MFAKIFTLFALLAVAFAAPAPNPKPQLLTYSAGLDYVYPPSAGVIPSVYSAYGAPVAYSAYPSPAVYLR